MFSSYFFSVKLPRLFLIVILIGTSSCTFLSNRYYVLGYGYYPGSIKVGIFLQRWPVYLQLLNQNNPDMEFIRRTTLFRGPWKPAAQIDPRAVDIQDVDDGVMGEILIKALKKKGYRPLLLGVSTSPSGPITVEEMMASNPGLDAYLFCFYSPTVYISMVQDTPKDHDHRSYGLQELVELLNPGGDRVIWAGPQASLAPKDSISHAFIYVSMTMFGTSAGRPLFTVADSQVGGMFTPKLWSCPPIPTNQNYWADAGMIQRLMCNNLACRLHYLIPQNP